MNTRRGLLIYAALCIYVGSMALATAYTWLRITHRHTLTVGSVIACTAISVTASLLLEQAAKRTRRHGRPRRAHARPTPPATRKDGVTP